MTEQLYKVMTADLRSPGIAGAERYQWTPGVWTPEVEDPKLCKRGWHLVNRLQLLDHLGDGERIWLADGAGAYDLGKGKQAWGSAQIITDTHWDDRVARLFAVDCAEHVRHLIADGWQETMDVIYHTIRAYAYGGATEDEMRAARDAARYAAGYAAGAAAWDAARVATRYAAWAAARAAARVAARDAERDWQVDRLGYYLRGEEPPEVG